MLAFNSEDFDAVSFSFFFFMIALLTESTSKNLRLVFVSSLPCMSGSDVCLSEQGQARKLGIFQ